MGANVRRVDPSIFDQLPPGGPGGSMFRRHIQRTVCAAINAGHLPKGAYLPSTADLADHWGVHAGTVKRALAEMGNVDLLESHLGVGWFVRVAAAAMPGEDPTQPVTWCAVIYTFDGGDESTPLIVPGFTDRQAAVTFGLAHNGPRVRLLTAAPMLTAEGFKSLYGDDNETERS